MNFIDIIEHCYQYVHSICKYVLREKDNSPAVEIGDHNQLGSYKSEHWEALTQEIELLIANFVKEEKKREGCRIAQEENEADEKEEKM